ncbi:MAG: CRISPR-associated endonuclease Cas2 [Thermoplasmatales archaeon]|jgi:CRISPR-associated protein Cas2|nr:CRISPR-associated endonuclease Cas2 [Thermoplasmatales archaeon]
MRNYYLVAYDIRNSKRLRKVFIKMRGYGDALQFSVFLCKLSSTEKMLMLSELLRIIKQDEDSLMIIYLGSLSGEEQSKIEFIGKKQELTEDSSVII